MLNGSQCRTPKSGLCSLGCMLSPQCVQEESDSSIEAIAVAHATSTLTPVAAMGIAGTAIESAPQSMYCCRNAP